MPIYVSPTGDEQVVDSAVEAVRLKYRGWRPKSAVQAPAKEQPAPVVEATEEPEQAEAPKPTAEKSTRSKSTEK